MNRPRIERWRVYWLVLLWFHLLTFVNNLDENNQCKRKGKYWFSIQTIFTVKNEWIEVVKERRRRNTLLNRQRKTRVWDLRRRNAERKRCNRGQWKWNWLNAIEWVREKWQWKKKRSYKQVVKRTLNMQKGRNYGSCDVTKSRENTCIF